MVKNTKQITILSILNIFSSISLVLIAYTSKLIIDYAIEKDINSFKYTLILLISLVLSDILFKILYKYIYYIFYIKDIKILKEKYYINILKDTNNRTLTDYLEMYNYDLNNILNYNLRTIPTIIYNIFLLLGSSILLLIFNYKIFIILFIIMIIISIICYSYLKVIKNKVKDRQEKQNRLNSYLKDSINNKGLCSLYNSYDNFKIIFNKHNNNYINALKKEGILYTTSSSIIYICSNIILLIIIIISTLLVIKDMITIGQIVLLIQLLSYIINPLFLIPSLLNTMGQVKASKERLNVNYYDNDINYINDFDSIVFDKINFKYDNNTIINNLNLRINKNDIIRISGKSGTGKSTLIKLLLGEIIPTSGEIYVIKDNIKYNINTIYNMISYLPQEAILFNEDIRTNFNLYNNISDDDIFNLIHLVKLDNRIKELELNINDKLNNLSTGEKQRLLLAISLSLDKKILILDEYNSALDKENNDIINNILNKLNKTIIYINHKDEALNNSKTIEIK